MNSKRSALFFCALLCSTFAHDLRNSKLNVIESQQKSNSNVITSYTDKEKASLVSKNHVYYCSNSDGSVIGVTNCDKDKALIIDLQESIVLIANGRNGAGVIIELETNVAKQITSGLWLSSTTSIESFISHVNCQQLHRSCPTTINISSPSQEVRTLVQSVLSSIDVSLALQLEVNNISGLSLAISYSADIIDDLTNYINVSLFNIVSTDLVQIKGGVTALRAIFNAIVSLQADLDVNAIIKAGVTVRLASILSAESGLAAFTEFCETLSAAGLDLSKVISSSIWSHEQVLINICIGLGGNIIVGVNIIGKVIGTIFAFVDETIKLDALLSVIINVAVNIDSAIDIRTPLTALQSCLSKQSSKYKSSAALSVIVNLVDGVLNNSLVDSDVDISAIIALVSRGPRTCLELVIKICDLLTLDISLGVSTQLLYATLVRVLLELLDNVAGRSLLSVLFPGLLDSVNTAVSCLNILVNTSLNNVLDILNDDGVVSALLHINITEKMYESCRDIIDDTCKMDLDDCMIDCSAADETAKIESIIKKADKLGC